MKFTLIIATINRTSELRRLLDSLSTQEYKKFEIIIVDQNPIGFLDNIVNPYRSKLSVKMVRSERGLSRARNLGLKHATGDIICFPDDDCWYDEKTLASVADYFIHNNVGFVTGKLLDENNKNCLKSWPKRKEKINKKNVWKCAISVTMFINRHSLSDVIFFDETLGIGANTLWGSGEETDYALRLLRDIDGCYNPDIIVFHPQNKINLSSNEIHLSAQIEKEYLYGCGMGRVVKLNNYSTLFKFNIVCRPFLGFFAFLLLRNKIKSIMYYYNCIGRIHGLTSR